MCLAFAFLFIKDNLIYVYQERFEGRGFFTLNINSGEVVEVITNKNKQPASKIVWG